MVEKEKSESETIKILNDFIKKLEEKHKNEMDEMGNKIALITEELYDCKRSVLERVIYLFEMFMRDNGFLSGKKVSFISVEELKRLKRKFKRIIDEDL